MNLKRVFLLSLILMSVSLAGPFSAELSISGGPQYLFTNNDCFNNDPPGIMDESSDNTFWSASIKSGISCFYKNTGLYISANKTLGDSRFNRYSILSGGLSQGVDISENSSMFIHVGTTWHSVDAAIHSFMEFFVNVHFKSLPGLDAGVKYCHQLSNAMSLFVEANYNYNNHFIYIPEISLDPGSRWEVKTISLNTGVMFSFP